MTRFFICLILTSIFFISCKSTNKKDKAYKNYLLDKDDYLPNSYLETLKSIDSINDISNTSDFYDIRLLAKTQKSVFSLKEGKNVTLTITNYGTKVLYLPEWFKRSSQKEDELVINIYKKRGKSFKKYVQKRKKTYSYISGEIITKPRIILQTKRGNSLFYDNIEIDLLQRIVDTGEYKAQINLNLSNFGYFKILTTEIYFKVID